MNASLQTSNPIDWARVRGDFPLLTREVQGRPLIYLDSANTGQKPASVIDAVDDFYRRHNANVSRRAYLAAKRPTFRSSARQASEIVTYARRVVVCSAPTFAINLVHNAGLDKLNRAMRFC